MAVFPWIQTKSNVLLAFVIVEKVIKSINKIKEFYENLYLFIIYLFLIKKLESNQTQESNY